MSKEFPQKLHQLAVEVSVAGYEYVKCIDYKFFWGYGDYYQTSDHMLFTEAHICLKFLILSSLVSLIYLWNRKIGLSDKTSKIFTSPEINSLVSLGEIYFWNIMLLKTILEKNSIIQFLVFSWVVIGNILK